MGYTIDYSFNGMRMFYQANYSNYPVPVIVDYVIIDKYGQLSGIHSHDLDGYEKNDNAESFFVEWSLSGFAVNPDRLFYPIIGY